MEPSDPRERPPPGSENGDLDPPPKSVGRYSIERQLGRGAFANVYLARAPGAWAPVALKVLRDALDPSIEAQARVRFLAEERIANAIDDDRVVRILETSAQGERPCYLAMQYVDGEPFAAAVARKRHAEGGANDRFWQYLARLGYEVAQAMAKAHGRDIVHRDLKPDNVLVVRMGPSLAGESIPSPCIKIVDFGIAKANAQLFTGIEAPLLTRHFTVLGTVMGSPPYMAPEQNGAAHSVTGKADVYALGVLLSVAALNLDPDKIELGELGFRARANFEGLLSHAGLPPGFRPLLTSMLALEADLRPNMRQVAIELGRLSQANTELGHAVHLWLTRSTLPGGKALAKISRSAPPARLWTDDERDFLLRAPLERLERPKGQRLRTLGAGGLLAASGSLGFWLYREHDIVQELRARLTAAGSPSAPARTDSSLETQTDRALNAQAALQQARIEDLGRSQALLTKTARDSEQRLTECRAAEQALSACTAQRSQLDERRQRAEQQAQTTRRELDVCQELVERNDDAAQVCRRELDARSDELAESTSRIRLCMDSLRAGRPDPAADPPGDG